MDQTMGAIGIVLFIRTIKIRSCADCAFAEALEICRTGNMIWMSMSVSVIISDGEKNRDM